MMEVLYFFPFLGGIEQYRQLPDGQRILYDQFALVKREELMEMSGMRVVKDMVQTMGKR